MELWTERDQRRLPNESRVHRRHQPQALSSKTTTSHTLLSPRLTQVFNVLNRQTMYSSREKRAAKKAHFAQVERHSTLKYPYRLNLYVPPLCTAYAVLTRFTPATTFPLSTT